MEDGKLNPDAHGLMYTRAHRLAERIGLTPEERAVAATGGLHVAELAAGLLQEQVAITGRDLRPLVLAGMLAVALEAVSEDEEFNRG